MTTSSARRSPLFIILVIILLCTPAWAVDLQTAYNQAGPGEGYDKLLVLDPGQIYTGYLIITNGISCRIRGNGALIKLDPGGTISAYSDVTLDVTGCIITGGEVALGYADCDEHENELSNCTLVGNSIGLAVSNSRVTVTNCIIASNDMFGVCWTNGPRPVSLYNNVWGNDEYNYATLCTSG